MILPELPQGETPHRLAVGLLNRMLVRLEHSQCEDERRDLVFSLIGIWALHSKGSITLTTRDLGEWIDCQQSRVLDSLHQEREERNG